MTPKAPNILENDRTWFDYLFSIKRNLKESRISCKMHFVIYINNEIYLSTWSILWHKTMGAENYHCYIDITFIYLFIYFNIPHLYVSDRLWSWHCITTITRSKTVLDVSLPWNYALDQTGAAAVGPHSFRVCSAAGSLFAKHPFQNCNLKGECFSFDHLQPRKRLQNYKCPSVYLKSRYQKFTIDSCIL